MKVSERMTMGTVNLALMTRNYLKLQGLLHGARRWYGLVRVSAMRQPFSKMTSLSETRAPQC